MAVAAGGLRPVAGEPGYAAPVGRCRPRGDVSHAGGPPPLAREGPAGDDPAASGPDTGPNQPVGRNGGQGAETPDKLEDAALRRIRRRLNHEEVARQSWYQSVQEEGRDRMRLFGRRLLSLLVQGLPQRRASGRRQEVLAEALMLGHEYGAEMSERQVPLKDTVEAFISSVPWCWIRRTTAPGGRYWSWRTGCWWGWWSRTKNGCLDTNRREWECDGWIFTPILTFPHRGGILRQAQDERLSCILDSGFRRNDGLGGMTG